MSGHSKSSFLTIIVYTILAANAVHLSARTPESTFEDAMRLYDNRLYTQAMNLLQSSTSYGKDPIVDGYVALCAIHQRIEGYEAMAENYLLNCSSCCLCRDVMRELALDDFDKGKFNIALDKFMELDDDDFPSDARRSEFHFKKGYCHFKVGDKSNAMREFEKVAAMSLNDYSAPASYCIGYIRYNDAEFDEALSAFGEAVKDERFREIAWYYIINCRYEKKDYDFVIENGVSVFEAKSTPAERKVRLARIISESYLVVGNKEEARAYYEEGGGASKETRADFFYAGNLMYETGDWQASVENYSHVTDIPDSLSQIAHYQSALAYVNLKNKVAALGEFQAASAMKFDARITEDAFFNYAKLAFDLNRDTSVFAEYIKTYSDRVRGEKIYSYMALTALADRDYQSAIDAYDKMDVLEGAERNNYVHANYLRGAELLDNGSYRKAMQCFKAVTYYAPRNDLVNQLARYALGESYYRNAQYADAYKQFTELYNVSAMFGMKEGELLAYNAAYSFLKLGNYSDAAKWFDRYATENVKGSCVKDAMTRKADCLFSLKQYDDAAAAYSEVSAKFDDDDIYPRYQGALSYGLVKDSRHKLELLESVYTGSEPSSPYYGDAVLEYGKTLQQTKDPDRAMIVYEKLINELPDSRFAAMALLEMGTIRRNSRDWEGALSCYERVVEQMPESGCGDDALMAIESIYLSRNTPDRYIAYLEKIGKGTSKTDEEKQSMLFNSAEQLFFSEKYQDAIEAFATFRNAYPDTGRNAQIDFYLGECYRNLDDKIVAADYFEKVMGSAEGDLLVKAARNHAELSFLLEDYAGAHSSYAKVLECSSIPEFKTVARIGMMKSSFREKNFATAADESLIVMNDTFAGSNDVRQAQMVRARSLLATSRRDEAFAVLTDLSAQAATDEGAEASFMLIQDCFDKGDFDEVVKRAHSFSESGVTNDYWLAKAFVLLGDTYAEQGKFKQAEATFRSVADGYKGDNELSAAVKMRLDRIAEIKGNGGLKNE